MKIVLFGGTTEGRTLAKTLTERGHAVTVHVATELGRGELAGIPGLEVRTGRLEREGIRAALSGCELCVDATHPYAREVTDHIRWACEREKIRLRRVLRPVEATEGLLTVESCEAAADFLAAEEGGILLTIGAKELACFSGLEPGRLFARVLPAHESLDACEKAGVPRRNIIAIWGPVSQELNEAILRQYQIRWLVTKESGAAGGFGEKLRAAREIGADVVVIARPEETGITVEELLKELTQEG